MRPFLERLVSVLTVLLAAFAMAQAAGAQTLPDSGPPEIGLNDASRIVEARVVDVGGAGR